MVVPAPNAPPSVLHTSVAHVTKPADANAHTPTQYVIRVSDERTAGLNWTVYRRYSEFRLFKLRLEDAVKHGDMCGHCSIMSKRTCFMQFPHRRLFWNTKEKVLEQRRVGLNAFLDAVAKHARTCRESVTCHTRPLMDQFLDVNDMRYTYLNVNMSDSEDDCRYKMLLNSTSSVASTNSIFAATPTRFSRVSSYRESRTSSIDNQSHEDHPSVPAETPVATEFFGAASSSSSSLSSTTTTTTNDTNLHDGRVLTGKKSSLPNLLDYGRSSRSSRGSFNDEANAQANRSSRLSDWETTKYQTTVAGRHSDPGSRNDLLSFASCTTGRRMEQRNRPRRVHLSSAAKRVKKLEEQEARFNVRPPPRQKTKMVLAPIKEEDADDLDE